MFVILLLCLSSLSSPIQSAVPDSTANRLDEVITALRQSCDSQYDIDGLVSDTKNYLIAYVKEEVSAPLQNALSLFDDYDEAAPERSNIDEKAVESNFQDAQRRMENLVSTLEQFGEKLDNLDKVLETCEGGDQLDTALSPSRRDLKFLGKIKNFIQKIKDCISELLSVGVSTLAVVAAIAACGTGNLACIFTLIPAVSAFIGSINSFIDCMD